MAVRPANSPNHATKYPIGDLQSNGHLKSIEGNEIEIIFVVRMDVNWILNEFTQT